MKGKLIEKIIKINHVLFFLGACVVIISLLIKFIPELFRQPYQEPKVELAQSNQDTNESTEIKYSLTHWKMINDVHVIKISSDKVIISDQNNEGELLNMFSMGIEERTTVNLLFINSNNKSHKLFEYDRYIKSFQLANIDAQKSYEELYEGSYLSNKNIYTVINSDTNNDGYLSEKDNQDLYISEYNGKNVKLIVKDIQSYELIKDDLILIEQENSGQVIFSTFNLSTGDLSLLDTGL